MGETSRAAWSTLVGVCLFAVLIAACAYFGFYQPIVAGNWMRVLFGAAIILLFLGMKQLAKRTAESTDFRRK
jgi:general stress protein CsbA